MQSTSATSADVIRTATPPHVPPAGTPGIALAEGKESIVEVGGYRIKTIVYPPSRVVNEDKTVTIYVAAGGQGFGHKVPMEAIVEKLRRQPDTQVIYDTNPPVHTFDRGAADHMRYKLSNWKTMAEFANFYRLNKSAKPQFRAFGQRIRDVTTNPEHPIHAALFNHRFGSVAAADALPQNVPMLQQIPDHGKPHRGWLNKRMLRQTATNNDLDRLIVANLTTADHARRHGVPAENIQALGYPLRQAYEDWASRPKSEAREALGIPADKRVLIMSAGNARDPGPFVAQVEGLLQHDNAMDLHLIALCADNKELPTQLQALQQKLDAKGKPGIIHTLGTQSGEEMARLLRAADLNAIQPGGGSLADCYGMGVVPIIWGEKSGIEHANRKHAQRNTLALMAFQPASFVGAIRPSSDADAQLFRQAVFDKTDVQLNEILRNQQPFQRLMIDGAENIAKLAHTIARTQAGFKVEDKSVLERNRPIGPTPGTPATPGAADADYTPASGLGSVAQASPESTIPEGSVIRRF